MKRFSDLFLALIIVLLLLIPIFLLFLLIKMTSRGAALYWSDRVGMNNIIFKMPKFRSMKVDTPAVATHLLDNPDAYLS
ncbi:MAG: sugar transferase, partial [Gammaproteobacteria bacterium]|nr:sugar transferase [Gammaproteobacteria bacterium]